MDKKPLQKGRNLLISLFLGCALTAAFLVLATLGRVSALGSPVAASRTAGTVHHVASGGDCGEASPCYGSLQAAVDAAEDGDEIRVAAGTYSGVGVRAGVVQMVYIDKSVTLRGGYTTSDWSEPHPISTPTTLDAQSKGRVLFITAGVSPTVEGLRITGGSAAGLGGGPTGQDVGGGVYIGAGAATISGCHVLSNTALWGGGLYLRRSRATLIRNRIEGNLALKSDSVESRGGGVYLWEDESVLMENTIRANRADWGGGLYLSASRTLIRGGDVVANAVRFYGGGLCASYGAPKVTANRFAGNTAEVGGGLWVWLADPVTVVENTFTDNVATWGGGGLAASAGKGVIRRNTMIGNRAHNGGGLMLEDGEFALSNNRVVGNVTTRKGGGLYLYYAEAVLTNTVIADNVAEVSGNGLSIIGGEARLLHATVVHNGWDGHATAGGSGRPGQASDLGQATYAVVDGGDGTGLVVDDATVALTNTILLGHSVGVYANGEPEFNSVVSLQATLWGNDTDWSGPGIVTHTRDYWGDPAFLDLDGDDYHISPSSAAVDRGVDAGVHHDMDGDPRPIPSGGGFDLGADEYGEIDLSASRKRVHPSHAAAGDALTYTIVLLNEGGLSSLDTLLVDPIPTQTTYISGSARSSAGALTDSDSIRWSGPLTPFHPVTITFSVTLEEGALVQNTAVVTDQKGGVTTLWTVVNGWQFYLPLIPR